MDKVQKARLLVVAIVVFLLNSFKNFFPESVVAKCCESPLRAPGLHGHWVGGGGGLPGRPEAGRWFPYLFSDLLLFLAFSLVPIGILLV